MKLYKMKLTLPVQIPSIVPTVVLQLNQMELFGTHLPLKISHIMKGNSRNISHIMKENSKNILHYER